LQVGGFDAARLGVSYNDVDFCLKLRRRGLRVVYAPRATLVHHESQSVSHVERPDDQGSFHAEAEFLRRSWHPWIREDPSFSPNLCPTRPDGALAWPPRRAVLEDPLDG
jgi:hypothetical protein